MFRILLNIEVIIHRNKTENKNINEISDRLRKNYEKGNADRSIQTNPSSKLVAITGPISKKHNIINKEEKDKKYFTEFKKAEIS